MKSLVIIPDAEKSDAEREADRNSESGSAFVDAAWRDAQAKWKREREAREKLNSEEPF